MKLKTVQANMTVAQVEWLTEMIYEAARIVCQDIYPCTNSCYDEDAGVHVAGKENKAATIWAGVHFSSLVSVSIVDRTLPPALRQGSGSEQEMKKYQGMKAEITFLRISIPALVQFVLWFRGAGNIDRILIKKYENLWESDGHYGSENREDFISGGVEMDRISRQKLRDILNILEKL